jgi:hypothetical protein
MTNSQGKTTGRDRDGDRNENQSHCPNQQHERQPDGQESQLDCDPDQGTHPYLFERWPENPPEAQFTAVSPVAAARTPIGFGWLRWCLG